MLANLHHCPTCNQDCEGALRLRRHLEANQACLQETGCTLDQIMRRLHSKRKMLTRDKEKYKKQYKQYHKQKVSAISVVIPRSFQFHLSGIEKWKGYIREQGRLRMGVCYDKLHDFSCVEISCVAFLLVALILQQQFRVTFCNTIVKLVIKSSGVSVCACDLLPRIRLRLKLDIHSPLVSPSLKRVL